MIPAAAAFAHRHHDRLYRLWRDAGRPELLLAVHQSVPDRTRPSLDSAWPGRNVVVLDDWDVGGCTWTEAEAAARHWVAQVARPDPDAKPGRTPVLGIHIQDGTPVAELAWIDRLGSPSMRPPALERGPGWLGCLFATFASVIGLAAIVFLTGVFSDSKPDPMGMGALYELLILFFAAAIVIVLLPFTFWMGFRYFRPANRRSTRIRWSGRTRREKPDER